MACEPRIMARLFSCRRALCTVLCDTMSFADRFRAHARQGMSFIVCGVLGAAIEFSILRVLVGQYGVSPLLSYIPSAGIPAFFVFIFNKFVTFRVHGGAARQSWRFVAVYSATFCFNYLLSSSLFLLGERLLPGSILLPALPAFTTVHIAYLAKAVAIGVTAIINYALSHAFIFRRPLVPDAGDIVPL